MNTTVSGSWIGSPAVITPIISNMPPCRTLTSVIGIDGVDFVGGYSTGSAQGFMHGKRSYLVLSDIDLRGLSLRGNPGLADEPEREKENILCTVFTVKVHDDRRFYDI